MADTLLTQADCQEALSRVYVSAVAAMAGFVTADQNFDRDGVDLQIRAGGAMRPSLDLQLKATVNLRDPIGGEFRFPLKRRNYDLLREQTMVPRILVVLDLPTDAIEWLNLSRDCLVLKRAAYWACLAKHEETENRESVTISIKDGNLFDVESLKRLMEQARSGVIA